MARRPQAKQSEQSQWRCAVNNPGWGRVMLLLLLSSCAWVVRMAGQTSKKLTAPQKMRLCISPTACANLTWSGDHYDGRGDNDPGISSRYWITTWEADHVVIEGKTSKAVDGVYPSEGTFHGRISPQGNNLTDTAFEWRVGPKNSGTGSFTLTW